MSSREPQDLAIRNIIHNLMNMSLRLAKDGKPFRGHNEKVDCVSTGLFLEMVNVLKSYDYIKSSPIKLSKKCKLFK